MDKNGWEDFSLVFKTDFLINAQEINYNLNIVDTALRSCSDGFIRFMKVKDIVALASRNLKKRKYPLLMTKYIQIYLDFKKSWKKERKKHWAMTKEKEEKSYSFSHWHQTPYWDSANSTLITAEKWHLIQRDQVTFERRWRRRRTSEREQRSPQRGGKKWENFYMFLINY